MTAKKIYEGKVSKPLAAAALGYPHLCITQIDGEVIGEATEGFNTDNLFNMIKDLARRNKNFRAALVDYIIELSEEV